MSIGEILRSTRASRGISLDEVEQATRIRKKYLFALEEDDLDALPALVYARGFIRSYAKFLDLDPDEVLALLPVRPTVAIPRPTVVHRPAGRGALGCLAVALFLLAVVLWGVYFYQGQGDAADLGPTPASARLVVPTIDPRVLATPTATPTPTALPTVTPSPTPRQGVEVIVKSADRSWVAITVDDRADFTGFLAAGEVRTWHGKQRIVMLAGNAGVLDVTLNDEFLGRLGRSGQVLVATWTKTGQVIATPTPVPPTRTPTPPAPSGPPPTAQPTGIAPSQAPQPVGTTPPASPTALPIASATATAP